MTLNLEVLLYVFLSRFFFEIRFLEALVTNLCEWMEKNNESHLVLLVMYTVVGSLYENQIVTGLKVVEKCIAAFFHRKGHF